METSSSRIHTVCNLFAYSILLYDPFGAVMANDTPSQPPLIQEIQNGLGGLIFCGLIGGACGIIAFASTQVPGFRNRYAFLAAVLIFTVAYYIKEGWQSPFLQNLPHVPVEIALYPVVSMFLGVVMNLTSLWMTLLIIWRIVSWLQNFKMPGSR